MSSTETITKVAYARRRGVTKQAVDNALRAGLIEAEPDGKIDPDKADAQWAAKGRPSASAHRQQELAGSIGNRAAADIVKSRAEREEAQARLAESKWREREGLLVSRDEVQAGAFEVLRRCRDALEAIPARLAPVVVGEADERKVYDMIDDEVRRVLDQLVADMTAEADLPADAP